MSRISDIDLILNPDGGVYHLHLLPNEVADTIITVGDPGRVAKVSKYFDSIEIKKNNREFITHTGFIGKKRISVISTGIGTGNIDIVLNEVDALVNIDLQTREPKKTKTSLKFIRIGTSGSLQQDVPVESLLVSSEAIGLDSLMHYYQRELTGYEQALLKDFRDQTPAALNPYIASVNQDLLKKMPKDLKTGITLTTPGFFASQGRKLNAALSFPELFETISAMRICGNKISNFEMETAGLYGLASCLGHKAISLNVILPNRNSNLISRDRQKIIEDSIKYILEDILSEI